MYFSVAIPTFNRYHKIKKTIQILSDNQYITEIVISDDYSSKKNELEDFEKIIKQYPKVKLYKNNINLGPFHNKIKAISYCTNEWTLLLDSDMMIQNSFFELLQNIELDKKCIYHSQYMNNGDGGNYNNDNFELIQFGNKTFEYYMKNKRYLLNTSNYIVNKNEYLTVIKPYMNKNIFYNDAFCLTYIWLINDHYFKVIPKLSMAVYPNSYHGFYIKFQNKNKIVTEILIKYYEKLDKTWNFKESCK